MSINIMFMHPTEREAQAMLCNPLPYPESFTLADRTAERMSRAREGLAHVMTVLLPAINDAQREDVHHWLDAVLMIVETARIDAEASVDETH